MSAFQELLAALAAAEGVYPDTMLDDLQAAYEMDMDETGQQVVTLTTDNASLNTANADANSQLAALKDMNRQLIAAVGASVTAGAATDVDTTTDAPEDIEIDDLFGDADDTENKE